MLVRRTKLKRGFSLKDENGEEVPLDEMLDVKPVLAQMLIARGGFELCEDDFYYDQDEDQE